MKIFFYKLKTCLAIFLLSYISSGQGLIIAPGAKVTEFNGNLALVRNWINNGTFSASGGIVAFAGSTQSLSGTSMTTFKNITISSGSTTTIQSTGQKLTGILLTNGTFNVNGNLTLVSTASSTALINGAGTGQNAGNLTMERYLPSGFGYKYLSSPFQAATVNEFSDDMILNAYTFYKYNESRTGSGWVSYSTPANILNPMEGYAVNFGISSAPKTVDITGVVNNGSISVNLFNHNNAYTKGYNLVGNPYPSPIDWYSASGWTKTNIDNSLYYFKASLSDQYGGTYSTFLSGISSDGLATNIIPSMQGFFVHVTDGSWPVSATLAMNNSVRITDQIHPLIKSAPQGPKPLIRFTASFSDNLVFPDFAVVYFDDKSTGEFDGQLDALKLLNTDIQVPNLYFITPSAIDLSIYALSPLLNNLYQIPLGLKINRQGYVVFKIRDIDSTFYQMKIYLTDLVAGTYQDILPGKEYKLFLNTGEYNNRFILNFTNIITGIPENIPSPDLFSIYYSQSVLHTKINKLQGSGGSVSICNLSGQTLYIMKVYDEGYHELSVALKDGVYLAVFVSGTTRLTKKIIISNR